MKLAIKSRFNRVKNLKAKEAPILFQHGAISRLSPEDKIEELLKTTQSSVSYGYFGEVLLSDVLLEGTYLNSVPKLKNTDYFIRKRYQIGI